MFASNLNHFLAAVFVAFVAHGITGCFRRTSSKDNDEYVDYACGRCGTPIQVTIVVQNALVAPHFGFNVTLVEEPQRELIHFLEKAAKMDPRFQYEASYHSQWGYLVTSINGVASSNPNGYYWIISDYIQGSSLVEGVSSHVPEHQDMVLFNLTSYNH